MNSQRTPLKFAAHHLRTAFVLASALLLAGCKAAFFTTLNAGGAPAESVVYQSEHHLALDVYRPVSASKIPTPIVIFLYGGRWQGGTRQEYGFVGERLAQAGVLTLVVDYRLYPKVRFPEFVQDGANAVAWARDHAADYGGDPTRIFVVGHSAGAHIAALLGTDARYLGAVGLKPRNIAGVIGIAGPYDFLPLTEDDLIDIFGAEPQWATSQPINFVDGDEPPFLLLHGSGDLLVWPRNSERLKARFEAAGVPIEMKIYSGVGHIRILSGFRYDWLANTTKDVLSFVRDTTAAEIAP